MLIANRWHVPMFKWNNIKFKRFTCQQIKARLLINRKPKPFFHCGTQIFYNYCSYNAVLWTITECYKTTSSRAFTFFSPMSKGLNVFQKTPKTTLEQKHYRNLHVLLLYRYSITYVYSFLLCVWSKRTLADGSFRDFSFTFKM